MARSDSFPRSVVRNWEAEARETAKRNAVPLPLDPTETHVLLTPAQQSVLAIYASLHGATAPRGCFHCTWKQILAARAPAIACVEFAAIVDAIGYHVLEALRAEEVSAS